MTEVFSESTFYTGPALDEEAIRSAEEALGVRLPRAYVDLLLQKNGGAPRNKCVPTNFATSWAPDHFQITTLLGIGGDYGMDPSSELGGSADLVEEWEYPDIGVVFVLTPSAGPDTVMLDYSECGPKGEPAVAYIDDDRVPRRVADSFEAFLAALVPCSNYAE